MYDPSDENKNPDGSPKEILGRDYNYNCKKTACSKSSRKRKMGYKVCKLKTLTFLLKNILQEFVIHQANEHNGLELALMNHQDERVRNLIPKLARQ